MKQKLMSKIFVAPVDLIAQDLLLQRNTLPQNLLLLQTNLWFNFNISPNKIRSRWNLTILSRQPLLVRQHLHLSLDLVDIEVSGCYFAHLSIASKSLTAVVEKLLHFGVWVLTQQLRLEPTYLPAFIQIKQRNSDLLFQLKYISQIEENCKESRVGLGSGSFMHHLWSCFQSVR